MAAIDKFSAVYVDGATDRTALYTVRNVTTGDTLDVSGTFSAPKQAIFLGTTAQVKGVCTISGSVVTIPTSGLSADAGFLMVWGGAA
jgi:hypothetical protein